MKTIRLSNKDLILTLRAAVAAFGVYFCMYAFRKPFTVASYTNLNYFGFDYKILIIIAQAAGYFISKFIGIKVISELKPAKRIYYLLGFIAMAELALLGFAVVPAPYNIVFMFINGIPLGMIWGIVFSYIEGRKTTDVIGLFLCASFVVSSGVVKSAGKYIMDNFGVTEFWMPFITGLAFIIPLVVFAIMLNKLPAPSTEDKALKKERKTLSEEERKALIRKFALPLVSITVLYISLTVLRDFRDNFSREIWDEMGGKTDSSVFTLTELPISIMVLLILGFMVRVKNNMRAFVYYHYILFAGIICVVASLLLFQNRLMSPFMWMMVSGFGMYLCYIPFNGIYFDRMIAAFRIKGNVGFFIYFVDAFGYLGSVSVLFLKNLSSGDKSWLHFYMRLNYVIAGIVMVFAAVAFLAFQRKFKTLSKDKEEQSPISLQPAEA